MCTSFFAADLHKAPLKEEELGGNIIITTTTTTRQQQQEQRDVHTMTDNNNNNNELSTATTAVAAPTVDLSPASPPPQTHTIFLVYDLESTGFDVCKDKIVQIGILVLLYIDTPATASPPPPRKLKQLTEFCSYVNPNDKRMSRGAAKVTGLTTTGPKGKLLRQAKYFKQVWTKQFMPQYRRATEHLNVQELFLVGHNSKAYDDLMLLSEMRYAGIGLRACFGGGTVSVKCVDTLNLAKQLQRRVGKKALPRVNLGALYTHFTGNKLKGAHDALADCRATLMILERLWDGKVPLAYVLLQHQEQVMQRKRSDKGLVTKVRLFRSQKQPHPSSSSSTGQFKSLELDRKSTRQCDLCGCTRSVHFAQCSCVS